MKKYGFFFFLIFLSFSLNATDIPSGLVSGNWTLNNSPYIIQGDIEIAPEDSLIIEAGVEIQFANQNLLTAHGLIRSLGNEENPISWHAPNSNAGWLGILIDSTSAAGTIFSHNIFSDGYGYVVGDYPDDVSYGGALSAVNSVNIVLENCTFSNNEVNVDGGAVSFYNCENISINNCVFSNNAAGGFGGAIHIENSSTIIQNSLVKNNNAVGMGAINIDDNAEVIIENTQILQNENGACAGIYISFSNAIVKNSVILDNISTVGAAGAFGIVQGNLQIANSTIANNTSAVMGGGIWGIYDSQINVINSIFWNNAPDEFNLDQSAISVTYSIIDDEEVYEGEGNQNANPSFEDIDNYNTSLLSNSPCIDAGTNELSFITLPENDIYGNPRLVDGDEDGEATYDIGAAEYQGENFQFPSPQNLAASIDNDSVDLTWEAPEIEPISYRIFRDNEQISSTEGLGYCDAGLSNGIYTYFVKAVYEDDVSEPSNIIEAEIEVHYAPTNLHGSFINNEIVLTWNNGENNEGFYETFPEGVIPTGWTTDDIDGDGYNWEVIEVDNLDYDGNFCIWSASYVNDIGALTPENKITSAPIFVEENASLKFYAAPHDPDWPAEHFEVTILDENNVETSVLETTLTSEEWNDFDIDLSDYVGQIIRASWTHKECTDQFYLKIDQIQLENARWIKTQKKVTQSQTSILPVSKESSIQVNRDLVGYYVYRNNEQLNSTPIQERFFIDSSPEIGVNEYYIVCVYDLGNSEPSNTISVNTTNDVVEIPEPSQLLGIYPNPFSYAHARSQQIKIDFYLASNQTVSAIVYNILGQKIKVLESKGFAKGKNAIYWDGNGKKGSSISSGTYFINIKSQSLNTTQKILILR